MEKKMSNKEIETIIEASFQELEAVIKEGTCDSNIVIPNYRNDENKKQKKDEKRYSEQELKQIFIQKLRVCPSIYYSVETPSICEYNFTGDKKPNVKLDKNEEGKFLSSRIDVSLYDKENFNYNSPETNLISHIEFKFGQCELFCIQKDFLKLVCEQNTKDKKQHYFVHYVLSNSGNKKTKAAIFWKYRKSLEEISNDFKGKIDDIKQRFENIKVFIDFVGTGERYFFSFDDLYENLPFITIFELEAKNQKYIKGKNEEQKFSKWLNEHR